MYPSSCCPPPYWSNVLSWRGHTCPHPVQMRLSLAGLCEGKEYCESKAVEWCLHTFPRCLLPVCLRLHLLWQFLKLFYLHQRGWRVRHLNGRLQLMRMGKGKGLGDMGWFSALTSTSLTSVRWPKMLSASSHLRAILIMKHCQSDSQCTLCSLAKIC